MLFPGRPAINPEAGNKTKVNVDLFLNKSRILSCLNLASVEGNEEMRSSILSLQPAAVLKSI